MTELKLKSSKDIAKQYECDVFQTIGFDNSKKFWVALCTSENPKFDYAEGWTLSELLTNIKSQIHEEVQQCGK